jgi:hypothetical protein
MELNGCPLLRKTPASKTMQTKGSMLRLRVPAEHQHQQTNISEEPQSRRAASAQTHSAICIFYFQRNAWWKFLAVAGSSAVPTTISGAQDRTESRFYFACKIGPYKFVFRVSCQPDNIGTDGSRSAVRLAVQTAVQRRSAGRLQFQRHEQTCQQAPFNNRHKP